MSRRRPARAVALSALVLLSPGPRAPAICGRWHRALQSANMKQLVVIAFVLVGTSCQRESGETERWWYCAAANPFTGAQLQAATSFTVCFRTRAKCIDTAKEVGFNCTLAVQAWCPRGREGHDDYLCYFDRRICEAADSRQPCVQMLP